MNRLLVLALGLIVFVLSSCIPRATQVLGIVAATTDGALVGADYWSDEPLILSAGLGFEGIIGISEYTEEAVREAGGAWYGSLTKEPCLTIGLKNPYVP